jgi:hypothetical protein
MTTQMYFIYFLYENGQDYEAQVSLTKTQADAIENLLYELEADDQIAEHSMGLWIDRKPVTFGEVFADLSVEFQPVETDNPDVVAAWNTVAEFEKPHV